MARFCTQCGNALEEGVSYCPSCGTKVDEYNTAMNSTYQMNYRPIQQPKRKGMLIFITLFLVLIVVIGISVVFMTRSTPEKTIHKFAQCYNDLDTDGMMECLEPDAQALFEGMSAFLSGLTGYSVDDIFQGVLGYMSYTDSESQPQVELRVTVVNYTSDTSAVVEVECTYFNGEEESKTTESIDMIKIDGKWYISMMGSFDW